VHASLLRMCTYRRLTEQDEFQVPLGHITVKCWGKDGTLRRPCRSFSLHRKFAFFRDFKFSVSEKRATGLMREADTSDNLYSRPDCHVVSENFSISKNTTAVDVFKLKFKVPRSASLIHLSVVL
jgi:hypothetical protein